MKAFSFAAILVSVCAMAACKVGDGTGSGGAGGDGGSGGSDTTATTSGTGGEGGEAGGTGGEGGGDECSGLELEECTTCCSDAHSSEVEVLTALNYLYCGCAATSDCAAECDTTDAASDVCGDDGEVNLAVDNPNCDACVAEASSTGTCYDDAYTACGEDDDCKALTACSDKCE
ncbi:hypothetical protein WMF37_34860 [Sorangium sp. So ce291]|uniref:hypothetical protein n=1 Tax=Sorangium sp. So ce291 TaxID=3133294 RepID=UPI003F5F3AB5